MVERLTKHKTFLCKMAVQVIVHFESMWTKLIKDKYHFTSIWITYNKPTRCSNIWRKICDYGPLIYPYFLWNIRVGSEINLLNDP